MAQQFLQFQSIVQYRIPIDSDGSAGEPEIIRRFTTPMKSTTKTVSTPKKEVKKMASEQGGEVEL